MINNSSAETPVVLYQVSLKAFISVLPCLLFLYVNIVMLFSLLRKPLLLESSRYILFGHLLITDSLQLFIIMLMYIFAVTRIRMVSYVCVVVTLLTAITVKMSPVNLAVMSLERYVVICFPLRHAEIATTKRTGKAIVVIWTVSSLDSFIQFFLFVSLEKTSFFLKTFCNRDNVFRQQIHTTLNHAFIIVYFASVSLIIIFTYIAVIKAAKSAQTNVHNNRKVHKTLLLHLIQLFLYLTSTLFNMINSSTIQGLPHAIAVQIHYTFFVCLIIFPKCLSPLIYGFKDPALTHIIKHYLTFGCKTCKMPNLKGRVQIQR